MPPGNSFSFVLTEESGETQLPRASQVRLVPLLLGEDMK
jgi:hypothetical protein